MPIAVSKVVTKLIGYEVYNIRIYQRILTIERTIGHCHHNDFGYSKRLYTMLRNRRLPRFTFLPWLGQSDSRNELQHPLFSSSSIIFLLYTLLILHKKLWYGGLIRLRIIKIYFCFPQLIPACTALANRSTVSGPFISCKPEYSIWSLY